MKLLREINEADVGLVQPPAPDQYRLRKAARAVVFNDAGAIALLWVAKDHFHKLPGGGLQEHEQPITALVREVNEEIGYGITNVRELGLIIEYSNTNALLQISYCYCAHTHGVQLPLSHTEQEISDGFEVRWVPLATALDLLAHDTPSSYIGKRIRERDLTILKHAYTDNQSI